MRKILPEFDEKLCTKADGKPYERFLDFVEDAQQLGLVVISRQGSAITVNPAGAAGLPAKQPGFAILPPQRPASGMALN